MAKRIHKPHKPCKPSRRSRDMRPVQYALNLTLSCCPQAEVVETGIGQARVEVTDLPAFDCDVCVLAKAAGDVLYSQAMAWMPISGSSMTLEVENLQPNVIYTFGVGLKFRKDGPVV